VSASFEPVSPQLSTISVPGIVIRADVNYWTATGRDADGYIQPVGGALPATATGSTDLELVTFDGPTAWLSRQPPDYYTVRVLKVDISSPLLDVAWFLAPFAAGLLPPVSIVGVIAVLDGIIPGTIADVESEVATKLQAQLNAGEDSISVAAARTNGFTLENVLDSDGIYTFASVDVVSPSPSLEVTPGTFETTRVNNDPSPEPAPGWHVSVYDPRPVTCQLHVPAQVVNPQDPTWRIAWTVTRTDTNTMFVNTDQFASAPGALQVEIFHAAAFLMPVDTFMVTCRLYRNLGYTVQEAFSESFYVDIDDYLDRHHPYVHWNTVVYFQAPGQPPGTYWTRRRQSRIHRTAVPGRCEIMRTQPWRNPVEKSKNGLPLRLAGGKSRGFIYLDDLPFPFSELNARRRGVLCDYCFFGGPTRTVPQMRAPGVVPDPGVYPGG
jgi:hypothetical protein